MSCVDCEHFYVSDCINGKCHLKRETHKRTDACCDSFEPRKKDIIPILDYIAKKIPYWNLVVLEDGAPMFTLNKELSINQIEIMLRCLCRSNKDYSIVEFMNDEKDAN